MSFSQWVQCPPPTPTSLPVQTPKIASAVMESFVEQSRQEVWGVRKHRAAAPQGGCWYSDEQRKSGDVMRVTTNDGSLDGWRKDIQTSQHFEHIMHYRFKIQLT